MYFPLIFTTTTKQHGQDDRPFSNFHNGGVFRNTPSIMIHPAKSRGAWQFLVREKFKAWKLWSCDHFGADKRLKPIDWCQLIPLRNFTFNLLQCCVFWNKLDSNMQQVCSNLTWSSHMCQSLLSFFEVYFLDSLTQFIVLVPWTGATWILQAWLALWLWF